MQFHVIQNQNYAVSNSYNLWERNAHENVFELSHNVWAIQKQTFTFSGNKVRKSPIYEPFL